MTKPITPSPVLPFYAILVSTGRGIEAVIGAMESAGYLINDLEGPADFGHTKYYREEMGDNLSRYWVRGRDLINPDELPSLKLRTNEIETGYTSPGGKRSVNIDPGYIDMFTVVAATCKKLPAAIYLDKGIYGIIQLIYRNNAYDTVPWTYIDYANAAKILAEYRRCYLGMKKIL